MYNGTRYPVPEVTYLSCGMELTNRELVGPIKGGVSSKKLRVVMALEPTTPR